jgi:hypothetical protein
MGKNPPTSFMVEDGSGGQPLYLVEVLHDEEGKIYLTEGWAKFFAEYDLKRGWSLILTHRFGLPILCVRVVDDSGCARAYFPLAVIGKRPRSPLFDDGIVSRGPGT